MMQRKLKKQELIDILRQRGIAASKKMLIDELRRLYENDEKEKNSVNKQNAVTVVATTTPTTNVPNIESTTMATTTTTTNTVPSTENSATAATITTTTNSSDPIIQIENSDDDDDDLSDLIMGPNLQRRFEQLKMSESERKLKELKEEEAIIDAQYSRKETSAIVIATTK